MPQAGARSFLSTVIFSPHDNLHGGCHPHFPEKETEAPKVVGHLRATYLEEAGAEPGLA